MRHFFSTSFFYEVFKTIISLSNLVIELVIRSVFFIYYRLHFLDDYNISYPSGLVNYCTFYHFSYDFCSFFMIMFSRLRFSEKKWRKAFLLIFCSLLYSKYILLSIFSKQNSFKKDFLEYYQGNYQHSHFRFPKLNFENIKVHIIREGCINETLDQGRSYSQSAVQISECFFIRTLEYVGSGGVIYINNALYALNVSYSTFFNCSCSQKGGAIFCISTYAYLRYICSNRCCAVSESHFAYIRETQDNQVNYL